MNNISIETLRVLSMEQITKAKSGHPGIALDAAPIMHTLYSNIMNYYAKDSKWFNRDRFVLAAGHGSSLLYATLHLAGFNITLNDLSNFRQLGSLTPGHPEVNHTDGVDVSSGPLGQGIPEGVGLAIAESNLAARFNKPKYKIIDHYTYVLCGDGDLQEGITQEAISLAGNLKLNKLIVLYDSNDIQLDGSVKETNTEDVKNKFKSMNWNYIFVQDGNDLKELNEAILKAKKSKEKPTIIEIKTKIGFGSSLVGTSKVHGSPLSKEEVEKMRQDLGGREFKAVNEAYIPYEIKNENNKVVYEKHQALLKKYQKQFNDDYQTLEVLINGTEKINFKKDVTTFGEDYNKATRVAGGIILDDMSKVAKGLIGGSADLTPSTKVKGADGTYSALNRCGRNIKFGVREHSMAAICNGIILHGGLRSFCSGFFVFSDYMKPAIRMAAIMQLPVIYIFTHDSIAVGEDGPTHEPTEQLTMLRSIPGLTVIRPADGITTKEAFEIAYNNMTGPTAIILTRQDVANVSKVTNELKIAQGAYIVGHEINKLDGIIIATGSEVKVALDAKDILYKDGIDVRVVDMASTTIFDKQPSEYKELILPKKITKRLAVEMSEATHLYRYVGLKGEVYNFNRFGLSGKFEELLVKFGFTKENIAKEFKKLK